MDSLSALFICQWDPLWTHMKEEVVEGNVVIF